MNESFTQSRDYLNLGSFGQMIALRQHVITFSHLIRAVCELTRNQLSPAEQAAAQRIVARRNIQRLAELKSKEEKLLEQLEQRTSDQGTCL